MSKGKKPAMLNHGEWMEYKIEPANQTIQYSYLGRNCYNVKIENASFSYCINETGVFPDPVAHFYLPVLPENNSPAYYSQLGNISGNIFEIDTTYFYYDGEAAYMNRTAYVVKTNKNITYLIDKEKEIAVFVDFGSIRLNLTNSSFLQKAG
ncbi:MAG: hypothetical protein ACPL06_01385 [Candidatus Anstonellales archaeon]